MLLGAMEDLATIGFALFNDGGNLTVFVVEDVAQEENRSLQRIKPFQEQQKGQRECFGLCGCLGKFGHLSSRDGFRQPGTDVGLALLSRRAQLVDAETYNNRREVGL